MPIFTSDLTSSGIIYADTITTNSNEDLTLNPAGTGSVVANARLKVNEISADDSTSVSIKSPLQLDSTLQVVGNLTVDANTLFVNSSNNRVGIGTTSPAYQVEIENTGANALLVLDRTDGAACFIEGQATRSAFGSVGATPLALAYNSAAVVTIGESGAITVNPDGDGYTFPTTDGSANQFLITDGSGTVSFGDLPGDISVNQISAKDSSAVSITSPLQTGNIQSSGDITANDINLSGNLDLTSNGTITIGAGDSTADLTLTHDGTDVYLTKAGTSGEVYVRGRNISLQNDDGTQTFVTAGHGGATELYHGGLGSPGLITTVSGGISIPNGTLLVNTIASGDSASVRINDSIETDGLTVNGTVSINNVQLAEINNTQVDSAVEDIDTWSATTYRAAKYVYRITNTASSEYQAGEIMVLHDGTNVQIAEYSLLRTGNNDLITFSVDIDSGNVRLRGSAQATGSNIKLLRTLIED